MSKVSILLPTYNRERYLTAAIDSVLNQTHKDWELLISDNCSEDNTFAIAKKYADQDNRIICWKNKSNIGALQNYNKCIEKASGDYIELFGADDIFESTCIEKLALTLDAHSIVAIATSAKRHINENGLQIREDRLRNATQLIPSQEAIHNNLNNLTNTIISPVMFRAKYKDAGFDMSLGNCADLEYWTQILRCGDLFYIDEILFNYRIHNGSETTRTLADLQFTVLLLRIAERNKEYLKNAQNPDQKPYQIVIEKLMDIVDYSTNFLKLDFDTFHGALGDLEDTKIIIKNDDLNDFKRISYLSLLHAVSIRKELDWQMKELDWQMKELDWQMKELRESASENILLQNRINQLSAELDSLLNSKSWNITAPLRMVNKKLTTVTSKSAQKVTKITNTSTKIQGDNKTNTSSVQNPQPVLFFLGLTLINMILFGWSHYDHALPVYDMACHLLSGFACADLLAHAHPAHGYWWRSLLSVNPLYPPFTYLVYGILKLLLGSERWIETLVRQIFASLLFASLYGLGKLIFNSRSIALLAGLVIFAFPTVFVLTHYDMLDIPGLSMIALTLLCFTWWQQKPTLLSSIILGIASALTVLTKNNCVAFLIPPFALWLIQLLHQRNWQSLKYFFFVCVSGTLTMLPWLIFACHTMLKTITSYQSNDYQGGFFHHLTYYLSNLPSITSCFLFAVFLFAIFKAPRPIHRQMLFINASGIGGLMILSLFHWPGQSRYSLGISIPIALYCSWAAINYWQNARTRTVSTTAILLSCFAFIQNSFTPYPLPRFSLPQPLALFLGIEPARTNSYHAPGGASNYPTPPADWGYYWVFNTIKDNLSKSNSTASTSTIQQLAIMPDSEEVSSTSYSYLAKRDKLSIYPFTPRNFTLTGAQLTFIPEKAKTIDWYLLKTGSAISPASHFCNTESALAYDKWCTYVRTSGQFSLVGIKLLPDGNKLELYKKCL